MTDFTVSLGRFNKNTTSALDGVMRSSMLYLASRVTELTPVDTGRARAGWLPSISAPRDEVTTTTQMEDFGRAFSGIKGGDVGFLSNNVHYIQFLDKGSSDQNPEGMVAVAMAELVEKLRGGAF